MDNSVPFPVQLMQLRAMQQQAAARQAAGRVLYDQFGQPAAPAGVPTPPPGAPAGGPQAPAPGMQSQPAAPAPAPNPMAPGGASVMAPQPQAQRPPMQIPPFKSMPTAAQSAPPAAGGMVPPPPPAEPAAAPEQPEQHQRPFNLRSIVTSLKASGVPPEQAIDMLDALSPAMTAENKSELDFFKAQNTALKAANEIYIKTLNAHANQQRADTGTAAETRRGDQGQQRIDLKKKELEQKLRTAVGAQGALKTTEFTYPKGADGKPDTTQPPIGVRGITKTGKIINLDAQGNQVGAQVGGAAPKGGGGQKDAVRSNIVKSGVTNSIARLKEIDALGDVSTSSFFGQHGDNPLTRGAYGMGKGMQSKGQQDADAKWASMIDEAIPVFTGGLRGSDAFRKFLIEQAPGPGDKPETIREKRRLFRQNIEGTSKAFFGKYSSDPSFWGPGVTADQVKGGGAGSGTPAGIPDGSKVIGKTPDGKDVYQAPDGKNYTAD